MGPQFDEATTCSIEIGGVTAQFKFDSFMEVKTVDYIMRAEEAIIVDILDELKPNDIVWDVGANIGVHTAILGEKASCVVAVEPYPPNIDKLEENIDLNGVNADVLPVALSDQEGTELFSVPESESIGNQWPALLPEAAPQERRQKLRNEDIVFIDVMPGDSLIDGGRPPPDILKVDVEGASHKVIDGFESTLRHDNCRVVYVEVHLPNKNKTRPSVKDFGQHPAKISNKLESFGFNVKKMLERPADFFIKAS